MEIVIAPDAERCSIIVADIITDAIVSGAATLGLATGSSPSGVYTELISRYRKKRLSFAHVHAFLLDEYVGLPTGHPESYAQVIKTQFAEHVDLEPCRVHSPYVKDTDLFEAARRYDTRIAKLGPIDVQILGIGVNGHIGFNEPLSALHSRTRLKTLSEQTRRDNARFFDSIDDVPQHVITQGLGTISEAAHLVLIASGTQKAKAIAAAVEGPLSASCPASILQLHPHATVVLDEAAASQLENAEFYRYIHDHKPSAQRY
ncbi:glucosamine-6-phosphate deaminase [Rhodococcus sp. IEGM 1409]|uniref:glucosamine-6-phosphate deaminase n=1 Tax=Rhodococcus sp. IEGM 1409 TaxID=3047082 RepID=UPI0024B6B074|nr:glucosamine-6-phosphate deaminase [Rhodococcus sp. IEGM 1409]MDI9903174.1 glucosamine-6-phosphate deaminase [Rhodococcus sp. IEGM 1409]